MWKWAGGGTLLLIWLAFVPWVWGARNPYGVLGGWNTDSVSHIGTTVVFLHRGFDVYRESLAQICKLTDANRAAAPGGLPECLLPERQGKRPLIINWPDLPRFYPPGAWLVHLPAALLWDRGSLSVKAICQVQVMTYLLFAQLAVYLAGFLFLRVRQGQSTDVLGPQPLLMAWLWLMLTYWALVGFYDVAFLALIFGAGVAASYERWAWGLALMSAALCTHFRALWAAPLLIYLAIRYLGTRFWRRGPVHLLGATMICLILGIAGWCFKTVYPQMSHLGVNNPAFWKEDLHHASALWSVGITGAVVLVDCVLVRNWLLAVSVAWEVLFVVATPEIHYWHGLASFPLLAIAQLERNRTHGSWAAFLLIATEWLAIYSTNILIGNFVIDLITHNI